jgi:hypothetical protein
VLALKTTSIFLGTLHLTQSFPGQDGAANASGKLFHADQRSGITKLELRVLYRSLPEHKITKMLGDFFRFLKRPAFKKLTHHRGRGIANRTSLSLKSKGTLLSYLTTTKKLYPVSAKRVAHARLALRAIHHFAAPGMTKVIENKILIEFFD